MIAMLQSGLNIKPVITPHYKAENYLEGFEMMASGQSGKVILTWSE
jgi:threonine 3-dehydrogenase